MFERQPITTTLAGMNVAVFVVMVLTGVPAVTPTALQLLPWGANFAPLSLGVQPWRLLACTYLHSGIIHIALNMWCLWNLGQTAERIYDKGTYVGAYLLCAVGGSIASLGVNPMTVTAGASGAIFGVAGLLITTFWMGHLPVPREQSSAMMRSLMGFAGYNLLFGAAVPGISNSAHLGGLFTGLVLGGAMSSSLSRDARRPRGFRWFVLAAATIALAVLFQVVKARVIAAYAE